MIPPSSSPRAKRAAEDHNLAANPTTPRGAAQAVGADDCTNRIARRARFFELQQTEPLMMAMLASWFAGPETAPPETFDGRLLNAVLAA
jgi:hypothetical protein